MAQANRVYSTLPTNTSVTRRAALGAIAAATAVTAAGARPTDAAPVTDPIFAAIEAHRKAAAVEQAAWDEVDRLHELADEKVGPLEIEIPSMIKPGTTVLASDWVHIEAAIPSKEYPDLFEHYVALLEDRKTARAAIIGAENEPAVVPCVEAWAAREKFAETVPTTLPGLRAMIVYADKLEDEDPEAFWNPGDRRLLETLATAVKALMI